MTNTLWDVVIVGGGPAGYSAALYCTRAGFSTLVVEMLSAGGQMATTSAIENYPGFVKSVDGFELAMNMQQQAEKHGAQTFYAQVEKMELNGPIKQLETSEGTLQAKTVILATGADPRMLGIDREQALRGRGISYCATCDGGFYRNKTVAIVGGGNSAAEDALTLSKLCSKVYLVHRRDKLSATQSYLLPLQKAENMEFVWNKKVVELGGENRLERITLEDTLTGEQSQLELDGLFVAIGRVPNTQLVAGQVELDPQGYVVADETTRTNLPGVFAVGDLRQKPLRQVVTAVADGAVASKFVEEYLAHWEN
ncbi:MAG: thioredoxin-disulfide reductase [Candidatus Fournierella pullistercoris]|uniref:Thioredoxin reductase n=1 Tax=Candidatus Allofournierella pullistercoris TaxID=2838597 RepID=A0A948WUS9_9FIRM|nr:thioredoxin-disulfide reductase [Candidatus Fournierella pullistercoris]